VTNVTAMHVIPVACDSLRKTCGSEFKVFVVVVVVVVVVVIIFVVF
jgi:hypothetical protein